jgi:nitrite reductase (NADH) small subunit/3-phenylpropionate/trans-cinnamate dioxygenase ferredoxin subunit
MAEFVSVGKVGDVLPGQVKQIELGNETKVCLANVDGTFYAIGGECTHQGGPLGDGELDGTVVTCPWHGSKFDVTSGEVVGPPARQDEPKYEVQIAGDEVQVAV